MEFISSHTRQISSLQIKHFSFVTLLLLLLLLRGPWMYVFIDHELYCRWSYHKICSLLFSCDTEMYQIRHSVGVYITHCCTIQQTT